MAQDIPVYLFTGFMDSGKTTLVEETLFENNFGDRGERKSRSSPSGEVVK